MAQNEAPIYRSQGTVPDAPSVTLQPITPASPDASGIGNAISGAAAQVQAFAQKKQQADTETAALTARADFVDQLQPLKEQFQNDPDFANAPSRFRAAVGQLSGDAVAGVNDPRAQADLRLHLTTAAVSAQSDVDRAALVRQTSTAGAALDKTVDDALSSAADAGSLTERQAHIESAHAAIDGAVRAGVINAQTAYTRKQLFDHGLDTATVASGIAQNPAATMAALDDPDKFQSLTPFERETLKAQAANAHDERTRLQAEDLAKRDPAAAAARYGTVTTRSLADQVYDRVIIPHESGGNPSLVGKDGEVGLGQIMPDTARAQAKKLGLNDVAAMDDPTLREALKNPDLNVKLGSAEWNDSLQRYGGNVWAAAAAYNKGAARADAWDKAAREKFGDHYSAAQFASVVDSPVAQKYVLDVARRMGIDPGEPPVSFRGSYGVASAVTLQLEHQANQQRTQDNALIALTQGDRDTVINAFKQGYATDPEAIARAKQPLMDAAARGNTDATVKLRQFMDAQATFPMVQEAYKHTPEQVEGAVAMLRAQIEKDGGTPQDERRLEVLQKVSSVMSDARKNNPVGLIERQLGPQSVTQVAPPQNPYDPQFASSLSARSVVASSANAQYGGDFKFFKPEERYALKPWFAGLAPEQQAAAIGTIAANTAGAAREAAFKEITDGKPATMFAAGLFAKEPEIASSIVAGAAGLDTYLPSKGAAATSYATEKATALPPAIFTTAGRLDEKGPFAAMNEAIDARYSYLSAQTNDSSKNLNTSRLKQAVADVSGGIVYHNGAPTIAPERGMPQRAFDGVVWGLTDKDMAGAQTSAGSAISAEYLRSQAKLRSRSDGTYYIQTNQDDAKPQYAVTKTGAPFVLDLRNRKPAEMVADPLAAVVQP